MKKFLKKLKRKNSTVGPLRTVIFPKRSQIGVWLIESQTQNEKEIRLFLGVMQSKVS